MEYFTLLREVTMHFLKRKISLNKVSIAWPDIENNIEDKNKTDTDKKNNNQIYTEYTVLETNQTPSSYGSGINDLFCQF